MTLEQKKYRKKRKHRKAKTEKTKTEKTEEKPEKKKEKNANTTKFESKTKFEDFSENNGATYSEAKTKLQKLGANSATKTTKPRKFTRKVPLKKRRTNVVPTLVRRFSRLHPLNAIPPSLRL